MSDATARLLWEFGLDGKSEGSHGGYLRRPDRDNPDMRERIHAACHKYAHFPHEHQELGRKVAEVLNAHDRLQRFEADVRRIVAQDFEGTEGIDPRDADTLRMTGIRNRIAREDLDIKAVKEVRGE